MSVIQLDVNHQFNSSSDSTPEQAKQNTRFAVQAEVDKWNASRVLDYEVQWREYVAARDARPDATNLTVPMPARAEEVFTDGRGWPFIDYSDKPVCAPHTYVAPALTPRASLFGTAPAVTVAPIIPDVALGKAFWHDGRQYVRII